MLTPDNEFSTFHDKLKLEQDLMKKYRVYSNICTNPQLKSEFEQVYKEHENYYNDLLNRLN